jgi:hypothetical protein
MSVIHAEDMYGVRINDVENRSPFGNFAENWAS